MIPYGRQCIDDSDIAAVVAVLRADLITQGPMVERFEQELATLTGAPHVVALCNATAALHLACLALGLGPGDRLWTSPNTFLASANCARYCGADVDFVDIDPLTWNLDVAALEAKLAVAELAGTLPKIVVPVAFAGQSCDMAGIRRLADRYGFAVIEDASHAIGASYLGEPVGASRYADATVFSFHPVKIITTGEGGAVLTRRADVAERVRLLRTHGMVRDPARLEEPAPELWHYEQQALGFNYRITDIQAALGLSQLGKLAGFVARRRQLAQQYDAALAGLGIQLPGRQAGAVSAWHLYVVRVPQPLDRRSVFYQLRNAGVGVNVHYIPVHTQPYYRDLGFAWGDFPQSEQYYREAITLPMFAAMSEDEQVQVIEAVRQAVL
ncbi:UDP-4-amino-4,6-dideoxy-N-acetyl-beta-L-altrosamine transaminase [Chitinimonas sp.]|uniref:UDP-4-amino-4, 6-dideoxy-N-acetyl-beta-L-altrosamine transaminase n=1 Tax=Chitinimonas sp. TaxID=1934313 RepID=UPI0035AFC286